ncbi:amidohydrolase family protein [Roseivirga sp. UBA838]|uniref:amidohydrolase family protein n=1 Tax=Roseivirga sp. UBA838 TaxID=1947393 RepID=UPI002580AF82|nr:amidohydrolase family protein [Roseivirga sp. UBA838]|tara:strand:- start:2285 stop:3691 length:1407 start_codon:yes stop_codon:yes gene_type:complete
MKSSVLLLLFALAIYSCQPKEAVDILITHAEVIDVESGEILSDRMIGIKEGSIAFISDDYSRKYNATQTIEADGKFVIPGLWDMHIHFRGGEELIEENKNLIPLFTANGITGVREAGGDMTHQIFDWQKAVKEGTMIGPKIFTSGPKLDGPGATWAGSISVTTQAEAAKAVDSLASMGVDFIKLYDSRISRYAYLWILEEAQKRGIKTSGHMPFTVMLNEAVEAGLGSIEHLYYVLKGTSAEEQEVTNDVIAGKASFWGSMNRLMASTSEAQEQATFNLLRNHNTYVTPTLFIGNTLTYLKEVDHSNDEYLNYIGNGIIATYQGRIRSALNANEAFTQMRIDLNNTFINLVPKLHEAGVQLLAGSDCGTSNSYVYPGQSLHGELKALVDAGLPEIEALKAATINGAKFLEVDDFYGSLKAGKSGDLLILNDNPLEDISNTQSISSMVLQGKVYTKSDMQAMLESVRKK